MGGSLGGMARAGGTVQPGGECDVCGAQDVSKVLKVWQDDFEGGKDAYQMREFGRRGPMRREGFEKLADGLMGQIGQLAKNQGGNA